MLPLLVVSLVLRLVSISDKKWAKTATINVELVCHRKFLFVNLANGVMSVSWKTIGWSVKSRYLYNTILCFINIIRINYTRIYDIQSFSYSDVGVIFDKSILSRSHKLADADPTGVLNSCYGTKNEQKNTKNTLIED